MDTDAKDGERRKKWKAKRERGQGGTKEQNEKAVEGNGRRNGTNSGAE
jgi:hypothetical protein